VGISKAACSPHSPLPGWEEKQAGGDHLGGENTTLGSGHKQGRSAAGWIGMANVQHPTAIHGGRGGMSLAPAPPPRHLRCWLTAPLCIPMLPSVAQSAVLVLPGTVPAEPGAEQGDHGKAQLHMVWVCGSPNGQIPAWDLAFSAPREAVGFYVCWIAFLIICQGHQSLG